MMNLCQLCNGVLREGDYVQAAIRTHYHELKSAVTYALGRDMEAISGTLAHVSCQYPQTGSPEGD